MLSVKQEGIKYHFWVPVWLDLGLNPDLRAISEYSTQKANRPVLKWLKSNSPF